jgi:hypothetical protein
MTVTSATATSPGNAPRASWLPMIVIAMGQAQMSLNINAK